MKIFDSFYIFWFYSCFFHFITIKFYMIIYIPVSYTHLAYQNVDLDDIRMMRIIDEASSQGLITLVHAGIDIGIYDHNYSSVAQILKLLKEVAPEKLVLAHMGNWGCWKDVYKRQR